MTMNTRKRGMECARPRLCSRGFSRIQSWEDGLIGDVGREGRNSVGQGGRAGQENTHIHHRGLRQMRGFTRVCVDRTMFELLTQAMINDLFCFYFCFSDRLVLLFIVCKLITLLHALCV